MESEGKNHSLSALINDLYQRLFGRNALPQEVDGFMDAAGRGVSVQDYAAFLRPVFAKSASEADTINAFYRQSFQRAATPGELGNIEGALAGGQSLDDIEITLGPPLQAAARAQQQARADATDATYRQVLGRGASAMELLDREHEFASGQTMQGADGSVLASNAARDVLAVLPVYVTANGGRSPSLRLQDGSTLTFGNAVELAGYLNRTAQRAAPNDPLLGTAYGQTSAWLQQVDQPVLETAIRYAQLAREGDASQAGLHQAASALALRILQQDPAQRHAVSTKLQQAGHETVVTVGVDGTATFHDKDPGPFAIIEAIGTIVIDFLAAFPPTSEIGVPLAVALHTAEAGQAFSNGNVLGGVLSLGTAATFGTASEIIGIATRVAGGVSGIVQGAQRGDVAGIVGGVLATAGGVAAGLGVGKAGFSLGEGPSGVVVDLQHALSAGGALTSFGAQVAQGHITDGLLNSLGPWLASLAAENYAKKNIPLPAAYGGSSDRPAPNQFADLGGGVPTGDIPASDGNTVIRYAKGLVTGIGIGIADIAKGLFYFGQSGVKFLVDATAVSAAAEGGFALDDPNAKQLNAAAQQQLAQDINQAGQVLQGIGTAVGSAVGDPVGTATELYNRYKAAEAEAAANGTLPEFYGRFTGRVVTEGGATVLTALEVARGLGLLIKAGDLSSVGAFDVPALRPVATTTGGTVSAARYGSDGIAIPVTDAADRALAQQVITLGDSSGQTSEALVRSVARKEGLVELPGGNMEATTGSITCFRTRTARSRF